MYRYTDTLTWNIVSRVIFIKLLDDRCYKVVSGVDDCDQFDMGPPPYYIIDWPLERYRSEK